jgi:hypothetical protein
VHWMPPSRRSSTTTNTTKMSNFFFLPAVMTHMTTSGRISGDLLRLLYIPSRGQAELLQMHGYLYRFFDPSPPAVKQRRGTYLYYNRAAIGLACAQATAESSKHPTPFYTQHPLSAPRAGRAAERFQVSYLVSSLGDAKRACWPKRARAERRPAPAPAFKTRKNSGQNPFFTSNALGRARSPPSQWLGGTAGIPWHWD